jgi:hypothetical protein
MRLSVRILFFEQPMNLIRLGLILVCFTLLSGTNSPRTLLAQQDPANDPTVAAKEMSSAATRFLAMLEPEQRAKANLKLADPQREQWEFVPDPFCKSPRTGLSIRNMTAYQRALAESIPATALSHRGYLQARTVMALEQLVFLKDGKEFRDAENYYVTIYGTPGDESTWGWRFEGHHLSINVTIVEGKTFSVTPSFIGTNPAKVESGPMAGTEVLDLEQTLAFELVNSLNESQLASATITDKENISGGGGLEVATLNHTVVDRAKVAFAGVSAKDLDASQQEKLVRLAKLYAQRFRPEFVAGTKIGNVGAASSISFAWYGGKEHGEHHYYRILSDQWVIEFANSQNNANHVHAVWRDFDGDFGRDLLGTHFREHATD